MTLNKSKEKSIKVNLRVPLTTYNKVMENGLHEFQEAEIKRLEITRSFLSVIEKGIEVIKTKRRK